ncbi:UPF0262 family protein [Mesorhizobium sp. M7A.F.Ca.MR.176.00.0.0]|uniref:UPF0262 family protein n=1 Tax=unclassified Mesorhizobium TaxID=325217 RepID=UPI001FDF6259|nr:UPF0262 family protein [Mesorhizobium sp. M7A.F.Ca.MR.176.00.0.0]
MTSVTITSSAFRLSAVSLDNSSGRPTNSERKHEQAVAIFDLIDSNSVAPVDHIGGPCRSLLRWWKGLMVSVTTERAGHVLCHYQSLTPFRHILKDYALVCNVYADAKAPPSLDKLEAIDMGRRAVHNEAAALLLERLRSKLVMDQETARRLFTLISLLVTRDSFDRAAPFLR